MSSGRLMVGRLLLPIVLLIVTTIYLIEAVGLGPPMRGGNMTISFFPITIAVMMYLALGTVLWGMARGAREESKTLDNPDTTERRLGPWWVVLLTALYITLFTIIGYFISTTLYVFTLTLLFGTGRKGLLFKLGAALVVTGIGFLLFDVILQVRLPTLWRI